jgi:DNA-binding response OmpR family regulator
MLMRVGLFHADPGEVDRLNAVLAGAGFDARAFTSGDALDKAASAIGFDVLVMRWDGADVCGVALMGRLRARLVQPPSIILLLDAKAPGAIGEAADLQLPDPCDPDALLDAVRQLAAQRGRHGPRDQPGHIPTDALPVFEAAHAQVVVQGHRVQLTAKEFALAKLLIHNIGTPLSRDQIMTRVWGRMERPGSRTLDAHIAQVRKRLQLRPDAGWRLSSVYGFGYRLDRVDPAATAAHPESGPEARP